MGVACQGGHDPPGLAGPGGARRHPRAAPLGASRPRASRQHAPLSTDPSGGAAQGRPGAQHRASSPGARTAQRARQQHATPARVPRGTCGVGVCQKTRPPYRCPPALHLSRHSDESCSVERALHGVHYPTALFGVGLWDIFRSGPCHVDEERDKSLALAAEEHSQTINGCKVDITWGREIPRAQHIEPVWLSCAKISGLLALGGATGELKPPIAVGIPVTRHPCTDHPCAPRPTVTARGVLEASPRGRQLPRRRRSRVCRTGRPCPSHPGGLRWLAALAPGRVCVRTSASGPWRPCSSRPCPLTATVCATAGHVLDASTGPATPLSPSTTRGARVSIDNAWAHATIRAPHAQRLRCGH